MSINQQEFTDSGRTMLGRAQNAETLNISKIVVGSGSAGQASDLYPLIALINHQLDVVITAKNDDGNGTLTVEGSFNSTDAAALFELRELGVMANVAGEPDQLYSVANVLTDTPETIDPASISIHAFKIKLVVDRATSVTITIGASNDILAENIGADTVGPGWFGQKVLNTLQFKRAVQGPGVVLTDAVDTITIGTKVLEADLDLYVPMTNPGGTPATRFASIQNALDYLADITIPIGRVATIHVDAGQLDTTDSIIVNHSQGNRIKIIGTLGVTKSILSESHTGTAGSYSIIFTVSDSTGIAVNDFVFVTGISGVPQAMLNGFFKVTAVDATHITVLYQYDRAFGALPALTGTLRKIATVINCQTAGKQGILIYDPGLAILQNIVFTSANGNTASHGIQIAGGIVSLDYVFVHWFVGPQNTSQGISVQRNAVLNASSCACTFCGDGMDTGAGGVGNYTNCYVHFARVYGFRTEGGDMSFSGCFSINAQTGFVSTNSGKMSFGTNNYSWYHRSIGLQSAYSSLLLIGPGGSVYVTGSTAYDLLAGLQSLIVNETGTVTYATASPPNNAAITADGALIRV
jgi:hypothetical protein